MNWIDIIISIVVLLGIWRGFTAGIIKSMAMLLSWLIALVVASKTANSFSHIFAPFVDNSVLQVAMAFIAIMLITVLLVGTAASLLSRSFKALKLGFLDRIGGGVFGAATGVLKVLVVLSIISPVLALMPVAQSSVLVPSLLPYAPVAKNLLHKAFDSTWNQLENPYKDQQ
ncbi:CvpA family protein [Moraxella catarrhalis]|uniref:Colicin V production protein n=1 Tax=Moraxella catarrhalis TaxID=480 RepID=A0A198UE10_MORCA|nr:CvpA family protein [Moraxella catarrhalis]OAU94364.1 Colicin V production protein [Moraxella catarrhalis]OAU94668.1 Colicin V production protein [Moraxella catarrhalis]OAU97032.1 Colicin V production protein [Moraxella catarrhalis]